MRACIISDEIGLRGAVLCRRITMDAIQLHVEGDDILWDVARRAAAATGIANTVEIIGNCVPVYVTKSDSLTDIFYRCRTVLRKENRRARERRINSRLHPSRAFLVVERRSGEDRRFDTREFAREIRKSLDAFQADLASAA